MLRTLSGLALALACLVTPAAAQKIALGFSASTAFSTSFVAANEGIFQKHGLDVEMKLVPNSATTPAACSASTCGRT